MNPSQNTSATVDAAMHPTLIVADGRIKTTSRAIAEHFGKNHKDVLRRIDNLECSPEFHERNFAPMFCRVEIGNGAWRDDRMLEITRDGFVFLAMGFTGTKAARWKEAYIAAFNTMEVKLTGSTGPSMDAKLDRLLDGLGQVVAVLPRVLDVLEQMLQAMPKMLEATRPAPRGAGRKKMYTEDAARIQTLHAKGYLLDDLVAETGFSQSQCWGVVSGRFKVLESGRVSIDLRSDLARAAEAAARAQRMGQMGLVG